MADSPQRSLVSLSVTKPVRDELRKKSKHQGVTIDAYLRSILKLPGRDKTTKTSRIPLPNGTKLTAKYKGKTYTATVKNGQVFFRGKLHSPTHAALLIVGDSSRCPSGLAFWHFQKGKKSVSLSTASRTSTRLPKKTATVRKRAKVQTEAPSTQAPEEDVLPPAETAEEPPSVEGSTVSQEVATASTGTNDIPAATVEDPFQAPASPGEPGVVEASFDD